MGEVYIKNHTADKLFNSKEPCNLILKQGNIEDVQKSGLLGLNLISMGIRFTVQILDFRVVSKSKKPLISVRLV